jgi:16S rRNA (guanine527-N7)-methyltransferase
VASLSDDPVTALIPVIALLTGRSAAQGEIARFQQYLALLLAWNRTHRLTGYRSADAMVQHLFLDALLFLARLPRGRLTVADIGTGPGIPGVPLRIVRPEIALTLIDSRRKQVSFLATLKRELDLADVVILEGRAEELAAQRPDLAEAFDVVVTRAVGMRLLPTVMLYLRPGGLFIAGGPPAPRGALSTPEGGLSCHWETVLFRELNLSRTFLLGCKPA